MKKLGIAAGLLFLFALFGIIWYKAVRETPEQIAARRNLEIIDEIMAAWDAYEMTPRDDFFDEAPFASLGVTLRRIDLSEAETDVKAVHARYVRFAADAPAVLRRFKADPPADAPGNNRALQERAMQDWSLHTQNMAIQLELLLRGVEDEVGSMRGKYKRQMKK